MTVIERFVKINTSALRSIRRRFSVKWMELQIHLLHTVNVRSDGLVMVLLALCEPQQAADRGFNSEKRSVAYQAFGQPLCIRLHFNTLLEKGERRREGGEVTATLHQLWFNNINNNMLNHSLSDRTTIPCFF